MKVLEVDYAIDDAVEIIQLGTVGKVTSLWMSKERGMRYSVRYSGNQRIVENWFPADELRPAPAEKQESEG